MPCSLLDTRTKSVNKIDKKYCSRGIYIILCFSSRVSFEHLMLDGCSRKSVITLWNCLFPLGGRLQLAVNHALFLCVSHPICDLVFSQGTLESAYLNVFKV